MKNIILLIALSLVAYFQVSSQNSPLNTFNKLALYEYWQQPFNVVISSLQQTNDKGYITCRAVLDSINSNGYHFLN